MPAVLNAANEVAVEAFLQGKISFPDIVAVVSRDRRRGRARSPRPPRWRRRKRLDQRARRKAAELVAGARPVGARAAV